MKKIAGKVTDIDFFSRKITLPTCPIKLLFENWSRLRTGTRMLQFSLEIMYNATVFSFTSFMHFGHFLITLLSFLRLKNLEFPL